MPAAAQNGDENVDNQPEEEEVAPPEPVDEQPNATMETRVSGQSAQPKRVGRWTLAQLRQTDGIIPSQSGWNKGDSQKLMTGFGTPRNTSTRVKAECLQEVPEDIALRSHGEVRLQSGTNRFASQKGSTGFGAPRDVCREGVKVNILPGDLEPLPEEKIRASDGIVRLQAGTNKYDSQKGMTGFGTARRETTKMVDSKHPEYDHERPDQSEIPLQSGTNKFASQKGMTGFGTNRRETCKIVDTNHPDYNPETSIDGTIIPLQMGTNKFASQKGMTGFGQPRWEVLDPSISWQNRKSQGMVRLQSGTNRFASQAGMTGFGTPRNTTYEAEADKFLVFFNQLKTSSILNLSNLVVFTRIALRRHEEIGVDHPKPSWLEQGRLAKGNDIIWRSKRRARKAFETHLGDRVPGRGRDLVGPTLSQTPCQGEVNAPSLLCHILSILAVCAAYRSTLRPERKVIALPL